MITGDFTDAAWLLLVEDGRSLGRVLGFAVYETEDEAQQDDRRGLLCDALGLFIGESVPSYVQTEIMTYGDFKASYGNRMPLANRLMPKDML